jgi:hypothetical protein
MIQPGMMFGGEGPVMQGTWYNPQTGDAFTVRDSFFEDNQYVVTTTDGRYLNYNQLQSYVQSDMKLEDLKKAKANAKPKEEVLPDEVSNLISGDDNTLIDELIIPEDMNILTKPQSQLGNIYTNNIKDTNSTNTNTVMTPANMNAAIIEKALGNTAKPKIIVDVDWSDYPAKQIEMLHDIMSISEEEIVEWYLDNIQMTELVEAVKESIKNNIVGKKTITITGTVGDEPISTAGDTLNTMDSVSTKSTKEKKIGGPKAKVDRVKKDAKDKK